jgi:mono/diheme cytochrome c family protein
MNDRTPDRGPRRDGRNDYPGREPQFPEAFSDHKITEVHAQLARDKEEPKEGFSSTPVFLVFLVCGFGFWAGVYLTQNSGGFSAKTFDLDAPVLTVAAGPKAFVPDPVKGEALYLAQCASCHQANGQGLAGVFPPLAGSEWISGGSERSIKLVLAGLVGEIKVKGNTYNGNMPAIGAALKDAQVANIITYVNQAWGNKEAPVTDTQVGDIRKKIGARGQYSGKEILAEHPIK